MLRITPRLVMAAPVGSPKGTGAAGLPRVVFQLNEFDVLMGRGSPSSEYSGNLRFRQLVKDRRGDYLKCTKRNEKHEIAEQIVATVHERGGRFLERVETLEEAQKLNVPAQKQAWKVMEASKPLFTKVKQLMRDVGVETIAKRQQRREERRKEKKESIKKVL